MTAPYLKPCPFCSETHAVVVPGEDGDGFKVWCDACCAEGPYARSKAGAVNNWNERLGPEEPVDHMDCWYTEEIDRLRSEVDQLRGEA